MSNFSIRPATTEDTEILVRIAQDEFRAIYGCIHQQLGEEVFSSFYPDPDEQKAQQIREDIASGNCFVSEVDGQIAGFIRYIYYAKENIGVIGNNAVSAAFRGQGIGPRQYDFVFDLLRQKGAAGVKVTTGLDEAHAPARRAYEKAGFSAHTSQITYYKKL